MTNLRGWAAAVTAAVALLGCGKGDENFRMLLDPVVAKVSERAKQAAELTSLPPDATIALTTSTLPDLANLGADLKGVPAEGDKQRGQVAAAQAYLSATQRFVEAQQAFARSYARLEASRGKVRDSLDAKVRTSQFSLDFWKETHDRLVADLDNVRKDSEKAKAQVVAATDALQQSAEAAGAVLGREKLIAAATLDAHRKALEAVPLQKGA